MNVYIFSCIIFFYIRIYIPQVLCLSWLFSFHFVIFEHFSRKIFGIFQDQDFLTFLRNLTLRFFNFFMLKVSYCAYDMYFSKAFFMAVLYGFFKIGIFSRFLAFSKIKIFGFFQDFWHF